MNDRLLTARRWAMFLMALLIATTSLGVLPQSVAAANDYPASGTYCSGGAICNLRDSPQDSLVDKWQFYNRECTSFVAWRLERDGYPISNNMIGPNGRSGRFSNAGNWASNATAIGFYLSSTQLGQGIVAQWDAGTVSTLGHIGYLLSANPSVVEEYNYSVVGGYDQRSPLVPAPSNYIVFGVTSVFTPVDFDGDGRTDRAIWNGGTWRILQSSTGTQRTVTWGGLGDYPFARNFNDTIVDLGYWHPADGSWHIVLSDGSILAHQLGAFGDIPVPATYDRNLSGSVMDMAVWRPSEGNWYVYNPVSNSTWGQQFGTAGDIPVPAHYDSGGTSPAGGPTQLAVWRPNDGVWYVYGSASSGRWGTLGDVPVPANYNVAGRTDFAVWRPSEARWYICNNPPTCGNYTAVIWGQLGDIPVPGDYDGVGHAQIAVFRPSEGVWYVYQGTSGSLGASGDRPV